MDTVGGIDNIVEFLFCVTDGNASQVCDRVGAWIRVWVGSQLK